jgi:uncharacterized membrane protein (UPF0127 family)
MRGLLGRGGLDPDEGMLLERTRSVHTFGMRFTIAAALVDREWVIRAVIRMPPGRVLLPRRRARHVLELPVAVDVRPGDRLEPLTPTRSRSSTQVP